MVLWMAIHWQIVEFHSHSHSHPIPLKSPP